jgi:hypothetical protein
MSATVTLTAEEAAKIKIPATSTGIDVETRRALTAIRERIKSGATDLASILAELIALDLRIDALEALTSPDNGFLFDTIANDYLYHTDGTPLWNPI